MIDPPRDATVGLLRRVLDRASLQAAVAASNLANIDTPGYRAREVRFLDHVEQAAAAEPARTGAGHRAAPAASRPAGVVVEAPADRLRADGNSVDVDREMTRLAAFHGRYNAAAQMLRKRFALLRYAANDGRGS